MTEPFKHWKEIEKEMEKLGKKGKREVGNQKVLKLLLKYQKHCEKFSDEMLNMGQYLAGEKVYNKKRDKVSKHAAEASSSLRKAEEILRKIYKLDKNLKKEAMNKKFVKGLVKKSKQLKELSKKAKEGAPFDEVKELQKGMRKVKEGWLDKETLGLALSDESKKIFDYFEVIPRNIDHKLIERALNRKYIEIARKTKKAVLLISKKGRGHVYNGALITKKRIASTKVSGEGKVKKIEWVYDKKSLLKYMLVNHRKFSEIFYSGCWITGAEVEEPGWVNLGLEDLGGKRQKKEAKRLKKKYSSFFH